VSDASDILNSCPEANFVRHIGKCDLRIRSQGKLGVEIFLQSGRLFEGANRAAYLVSEGERFISDSGADIAWHADYEDCTAFRQEGLVSVDSIGDGYVCSLGTVGC
jgi:hypothetical protein